MPRLRRRDATARFIVDNMRLAPAPAVPAIVLYQAHEGSGLGRLLATDGRQGAAPYWAYAWPGGAALARYVLANPETVAGRSVLDLGAGSGLVAIAAARAGATRVIACDIDPHARAAIALNAAANGVAVEIVETDLLDGPAPAVDVVTAADVFYQKPLAERATGFLERCAAAGILVLAGDLGRAWLPLPRLELLAEYPVFDVGDPRAAPTRRGMVFSLR